MKKMKKVVDERQELELYKIEHLCFWIVFWLLLGSIIVQSMFLNAPFSQWGFEWAIFMISCGGVIVGCYKKGQWDFYSKPTTKNYLIYSLIGAGAFAIIYAITLYMNHAYLKGHLLALGSLTLLIFALLFALIFVALFVSGTLIKKRQKKLEDQFSDHDPQ
ncbi:DUF6773 family protein [Acetobacterium carbinolicum]|jgi:hypothetical protein|uniref:DUF6773 family protein n=1 Tax=Acetobacterium TaxID=33951 RepID=UPI000DBEB979|nr:MULTISPECIES: DUF6773 family protein [unclassified Acetobacterium]AWW27821.1 hypothetical protein DOZ58_14935 [Acetobacterium sp. KB-1]MDZ5726332.1 DUF6773 family protein [Acetobacterium sp. K1/6]